ncbi:MAG: COX15/CtaA family protein, partial [Acidobacteria bacterium]|nr:COX15/CtaA family protein [Acidobacteriota bacterium]
MSSSDTVHPRLARFAWTVLGVNLLVIVWGALVRATGSGAGCGSHWPLCNGEVVPLAPATQTLIEYTHRLTSGAALILVIALVLAVRRVLPKGHAARTASFWSLVLIVIEALIGAGLVIFGLVEDNASLGRAVYMALHLTNTFLLLGALTLTARWVSIPASGFPAKRNLRLGLYWVGVGGAIVAGISGAIAALGDTLFPATSLQQALAQDISGTAHILLRLRALHPLLAVAAALVMLVLARRQLESHRAAPGAQSDARRLMLLVLLQ